MYHGITKSGHYCHTKTALIYNNYTSIQITETKSWWGWIQFPVYITSFLAHNIRINTIGMHMHTQYCFSLPF